MEPRAARAACSIIMNARSRQRRRSCQDDDLQESKFQLRGHILNGRLASGSWCIGRLDLANGKHAIRQKTEPKIKIEIYSDKRSDDQFESNHGPSIRAINLPTQIMPAVPTVRTGNVVAVLIAVDFLYGVRRYAIEAIIGNESVTNLDVVLGRLDAMELRHAI
jgi:hypothetical protein